LCRFSLNTVWRQVIALCNFLILYVTTYLLYFILFHCEIATYYIFMTKVICGFIATIFTVLVICITLPHFSCINEFNCLNSLLISVYSTYDVLLMLPFVDCNDSSTLKWVS
jgi:hypothetical protein